MTERGRKKGRGAVCISVCGVCTPVAGLKTATKQKRAESGTKPYVAPPSIDLSVSLSLSLSLSSV